MSKEICQATTNLAYHVQELKRKLKNIYEARQDMLRYPNTPKYELIVSALLPKLEAEVEEEKKSVQLYSEQLSKLEYVGNDDYENWYS